jgi:hypothetical protein
MGKIFKLIQEAKDDDADKTLKYGAAAAGGAGAASLGLAGYGVVKKKLAERDLISKYKKFIGKRQRAEKEDEETAMPEYLLRKPRYFFNQWKDTDELGKEKILSGLKQAHANDLIEKGVGGAIMAAPVVAGLLAARHLRNKKKI